MRDAATVLDTEQQHRPAIVDDRARIENGGFSVREVTHRQDRIGAVTPDQQTSAGGHESSSAQFSVR
jgi:hypothetical protein